MLACKQNIQENGCPHRKKQTMWKSILFSLEMAAPKPSAIYRNSPQVLALCSNAEVNSVSQSLQSANACSKENTIADTTETSNNNTDSVDDKVSPQEQISQSLKQSQFSSYTKFYSSIEENEILEEVLDIDVPAGFGLEYHGHLSKANCEKRLLNDGEYLVRRSCTKKNAQHLILSLRFDGKLKHYQLLYDEAKKVYSLGPDKEKFNTLHELVAKGFVTLYMESRAGNYLPFISSLPTPTLEDASQIRDQDVLSGNEACHKIFTDQRSTKDSSLPKDSIDNYNADREDDSSKVEISIEGTGENSDNKLEINDVQPNSLDVDAVPYAASPYYEVTRSLRRYNASKNLEKSKNGIECSDINKESIVPDQKHSSPQNDSQENIEKSHKNSRDYNRSDSSKDSKADSDDEKVVNNRESSNKRASRFWKFGPKKDPIGKDSPDDITGIPHNFKIQTFTFTWCSICTHFLFGVRRQGVRCIKCKLAAHTACAAVIPNDCTPQLAELSGIFGKDLSTLMCPDDGALPLEHPLYSSPSSPSGVADADIEDGTSLPHVNLDLVPVVVKVCVEEIESRGLSAEGIYRVSGGMDHIQAARIALEKGGGKEAVSEASLPDINAVAGVLKLFFRQLPLPLITERCFGVLLQAYECTKDHLRPDILRVALRLLPPAHYHTLIVLLQHFTRIVENSSLNKMTATSLSVVFAPTLVEHNPAISSIGTNALLSNIHMVQSRGLKPDASVHSHSLTVEEKRCPLASAEELDCLDSDEELEWDKNGVTENKFTVTSKNNNTNAECFSSSNVASCGSLKNSVLISGSESNLSRTTAGFVDTTSSIIGVISGTRQRSAIASVKNCSSEISYAASRSSIRTGPIVPIVMGGVNNPCYLSSTSLATSVTAPHPDITPDHLLCMKFAALEPKVLELLIQSFPTIAPPAAVSTSIDSADELR